MHEIHFFGQNINNLQKRFIWFLINRILEQTYFSKHLIVIKSTELDFLL